MTGQEISSYLKQLCRDIDSGRPARRFDIQRAAAQVALPAALGIASLGIGGCVVQDQNPINNPNVIVIEPQPVEVCNDGIDNDGDRFIDCADSDCNPSELCPAQVALYAVVMPPEQEVCNDRVDNDRDGLVDCDDSDCASTSICSPPVMMYGIPMPVAENCRDGVDNDRDGAIDCADSDCIDADNCLPTPEYAVPFEPAPSEICGDGVDNDGDGRIDCDDSDCPCAVALYGIPEFRE